MRTFKGGVHPSGNKARTCQKAVEVLPPPAELVFPLSQHIGAPAVPCVKVGEQVKKGQKIAEMSGFMSANIYSSVSGTVTAIEKRMTAASTEGECIVIKNDGENLMAEPIDGFNADYTKLSPEKIIEIIKEAGIVGMGGAAFPTHVKLSVPSDAKIDYVIVNGAECEPYLTSDHRAMLETTDDIIGGLEILMYIFGLSDGYIGIENNKSDAIEKLKAAAEKANKKSGKNIHVMPLKTKYPQGAEKQLIYSVCGRRLKPGSLPWQAGCIVNNIDTCASVYRAVTKGIPLTHRIVTVSGDAIENPANYYVPMGTSFEYIAEKAGGFCKTPHKVIMGGPMMGKAVCDIKVPVVKGTSGILFLSKEKSFGMEESPCIRCAKCVYVCPMKLQPNFLDSAARTDDFEKLEKLNIADCIECGSCAYVCPSKRHQVQQIHSAKIKMRSRNAK